MSAILQEEIGQLKGMLNEQTKRVESAITSALAALRNHDPIQAQMIIDRDQEIDQAEIELEELALKILTLHQPVARDLRMIFAVVKINNELERMGDLAARIAKRVKFFSMHERLDVFLDLSNMAIQVKSMVKRSLDAFQNSDLDLAYQICQDDEKINEMRKSYHRLIVEEIKRTPAYTEGFLELVSLVRHLERLADMAVHISEETIFFLEGKIIRHVY